MASQLDIIVTADTASATSALGKVAATAEREMARASRAALSAAKDNDRFVASIEKQVATFGLSGTALMRYEAQIRGISNQVEPLAAKLDAMRAAAVISPAAAANASSYARGLGEVEAAAGHAAHGTAGITRELLVMGHEASQGNWKRLGGSFMVLSEFGLKAAGAVLLAWGPVLLLGAGLVAIASQAVVGVLQQQKFNRELLLTGNYAGITAGDVNRLTAELAEAGHVSAVTSRAMVTALAATGDVGPRQIKPMADAMLAVQKASGATTEEVVRDFEKMTEEPAKWAREHNKAFNFITGDQYAYIKRLEEQGLKEQAAVEVSRLLSDHLKGPLSDSLYHVGDLSRGVAEDFGKLIDAMRRVALPDTLEDKLKEAQGRLAAIREQAAQGDHLAVNRVVPKGLRDAADAAAEDEVRQINMDILRKGEEALTQAETERIEKIRVAAIESRDRWREETKGISLVNKELEKYRTLTVEPLKGTANAVSAEEQAKAEAAIHKRFDPVDTRDAKRLDTRYQDRLEALTAEGIKLDAESRSFDLYGKSVDHARLALLNLEVAQGKLKGLSPAKIAGLQGIAGADDAKDKTIEEAKSRAKATEEVSKYIGKIRDETAEVATNARERDLATGFAYIEARATQLGTEATVEDREAMRVWVGVKHDQMLARKLAADQLNVDDEVHKLDIETSMLGLSTEARKEAVAVLKIYNDAQKDIAANPNQTGEIEAARAKKTDELTAAMKRNHDATISFSTGAQTALQNYQDSAANAGKFAETVIGSGLDKLTDALATFAETGKLHLGSLFLYMAEEFLKQLIRMQVAAAAASASSSAGGIFGSLLSLLGMGSTTGGYDFSGTGSGAAEGFTGATNFAVGTNVIPYDNYKANLHKGEAVVPAAFNPALHGMGGGMKITINNNHPTADVQTKDDGSGGVEFIIQKAAERGAAMGHARVVGELNSGGTAARAVQNRFGLSTNLAKRA